MKRLRTTLRASFENETDESNPLGMMLSAGFELSERENDLLFEAIATVVAGIPPSHPPVDISLPMSPRDARKDSENEYGHSRYDDSNHVGKDETAFTRRGDEFYTPELKPSPDPHFEALKSPDVQSRTLSKDRKYDSMEEDDGVQQHRAEQGRRGANVGTTERLRRKKRRGVQDSRQSPKRRREYGMV
mmetsp:Transcript_1141/g.2613  ORF Transcript_1141/g.2613 Transcript_1141/m.2613 type:complete len:188 (-) Transcript_1141:592-1155(-)|eukprot:CAMPEP_0114525788 /NCGR_PEP_ID=MMETSP0109-20121206/22634_1 /TAXON_ID=29199 /ORGANISM="Chlorarachnion reptans, Strain CCCM449" /LENGTH=187 /DNA_ID=CAMNT_0001707439 /DNA_START=277 /DNA_END=840 /DNA_ORIENTATION=+